MYGCFGVCVRQTAVSLSYEPVPGCMQKRDGGGRHIFIIVRFCEHHSCDTTIS